MAKDKTVVLDMNKRILADLQKVEFDRTTQIKKLIISCSQALAENSQRVKQVFEDHPDTVAKLRLAFAPIVKKSRGFDIR